MNNKKLFFSILLLIVIAALSWGGNLTATVRETSGKVEVSKGGGGWVPVNPGDVLSAGDTISTGFNSKAVLALGNSSVLVANALTRLTIAELVEREGTVDTDLFLDVGSVRSEVHSSEKVSHNFTVRNANSTASVRGTVLDVEILGNGAGMKVMAWDGAAVVTDLKTGRSARVGSPKRSSGGSQDEKEEGDEEEGEGDEEGSDEGGEELAAPSDPPPETAAAPLMASGTGGGMVSSMASAMSGSTVTVSTKPPSPAAINVGGGGSASTDDGGTIAEVIDDSPIAEVVSTISTINIQVTWPE